MAPPCGVIGLKSSMEHFKIREINTRVVKKKKKKKQLANATNLGKVKTNFIQ